MKYFTYSDYIKSIHTLRLNNIVRMAEDIEIYNETKEKQTDDVARIIMEEKDKKGFKNDIVEEIQKNILEVVFRDKGEIVKFLNFYLNPEITITEERIERYSNCYLEKTKNRNIIFKIKDLELFFVISVTRENTNKVIYSNTNSCIDIMRYNRDKSKGEMFIRLPVIIPIIIYYGNENWNERRNHQNRKMKQYLNRNQISEEMYNECEIEKINMKYNMIDKKYYEKNNSDVLILNIFKLFKKENTLKYIYILKGIMNKKTRINDNLLIEDLRDTFNKY